MSTARCPYCYLPVDTKIAKFQCTGKSAPGKIPCAATPPDQFAPRLVLTGYTEPYRPSYSGGTGKPAFGVCPDCGSAPQTRVCNNCETPLPPDFFSGHNPLIGMVGAKNTGKTVYLAVLSKTLRTSIGRRFNASITVANESRAAEDVKRNAEKLYDRQLGRLPDVTGAHRGQTYGRDPIVLNWVQQSGLLKRRSSALLSFYDTAGEDLQTMDSVRDQDYLGAADGVVVMLDPFQLPGNRQEGRDRMGGLSRADLDTEAVETLNRVADFIRAARNVSSAKKIGVPVAVAFSKIDAFLPSLEPGNPLVQRPMPGPYYDERDGRAVHEYVKALLSDWEGDDITRFLDHNFSKFRFFGVSALGAEPDYGAGTVDPDGVRPLRVEDPILWLLAERDFIKRGNK